MMAKRVLLAARCVVVCFLPGAIQAVDNELIVEPEGFLGCWATKTLPNPGPLTPCFEDGVCRCSNDSRVADCSSNHGYLTFVPYLPGDFHVFNFSHNRLSEISDHDFFSNASRSVQFIDLYSNGLTYIARGAFDRFQLKMLFLGGNQLKWPALADLIAWLPSLPELDISCNDLPPIPNGTLAGAGNSRLSKVYVSLNRFPSLDLEELQPLRHLEHVTAEYCRLSSVKAAFIPTLKELSLKKNRLFNFPATCQTGTDGVSLLPNLVYLQLEFNFIRFLSKAEICLPGLKYLDIKYNRIMNMSTDLFSRATFPNLTVLNLARMEAKVNNIDRFAFNNSLLTRLDVSFNNVDFSDSHVVDEDAIRGCTGLINIKLSGNKFQAVTAERFQTLFRDIKRTLEVFHLEKCGIAHLSPQFFAGFSRLQSLYLYGNFLEQLQDGVFDNLRQLNFLNMDTNKIAVISPNTFSDETRQRVQRFDLSGNPFDCTCHLLWFQHWMLSSPGRFVGWNKGYRCKNLPHTDVTRFQASEQACMLGKDAAAFTTVTSCLLLSFLFAFVVFFRYRWRLRLWLYEACRGKSRTREGDFRYDAFVAYASEDLPWIQGELLPVLEGRWGLRLCVHQRDFQLGKHIVENIADCMEVSRRVLLIFSPHFAASEWCQFELTFCQVSVMEHGDVMVLVELQPTDARDMTSAMRAVLHTTTYIEWDDDIEARASFWGRLRLALGE